MDEYVRRVPGYHVTWYPVPYPAAPVSAGLATSTYRNTYFQSIASGIKETELILKLRAARCPKERYVFAGYSQGAMVMHRTIYRLGVNKTTRTSRQTLLPRVAAVFAIGDGDKTPYQGGVNYGASDSRRGLIWVINGGDPFWPSAKSARIPTTGYGWYPLRFMSICATNDFVCDPTYGIPSIKVHTTSYRPPSGKMLSSIHYAATRAANTTKFIAPRYPTITTAANLGTSKPGQAYTKTLNAWTFTGATTWARTSGTLPPGIRLSSTGKLSGTPTSAGTYSFAVRAKNAAGGTHTRPFTLKTTITPKVATGGSHTCAISPAASVKCWGSNYAGMLGDGSPTRGADGWYRSSATPVQVTGLTSGVKDLSASGLYTCAVTKTRTVKCWGSNTYANLGNGTTRNSSVPVTVTGLTNAKSVATGEMHACALTTSGTVKCWGNHNMYGQLGNGTQGPATGSLVTVVGLTNVTAIAAGARHTCATTATGSVKCWGQNMYGQLGVRTSHPWSTVPVTVVGLTNVTAISAQGDLTCALTVARDPHCWGDSFGGTFLGSNVPIGIPALPAGSTTAITVGEGYVCVITAAGAAKCWAEDRHNSTDPVQVPGLTSHVTSISPAYEEACAVQKATVFCWGDNYYGQLGNGTFADSATPVPTKPL